MATATLIAVLLCAIVLGTLIKRMETKIMAGQDELDQAITDIENEVTAVVADITAKNEAAGNPIDFTPEITRLNTLTATLKSVDPGSPGVPAQEPAPEPEPAPDASAPPAETPPA